MTRWLRWAWPAAILIAWLGLTIAGIDPREALVRPLATLEGSRTVAIGLLVAYLVRAVLLLPATLLALLCGIALGIVWGSLVAIVGSTVSALLAYVLAHRLGSIPPIDPEDVEERSRTVLGRMAVRLQDDPFSTMLIARLALLPGDVVNLVAGASRVPWRAFVAATALGGGPGILAAVLAGASLDPGAEPGTASIDVRALVASVVLAGVTALVALWLRRRRA